MAGKFKFSIVKGNDADRTLSEKLFLHKFSGVIRIVGFVCLLLLVIIILASHYSSQLYTKISEVGRVERLAPSGSSYMNNNGSIITYSKDGVSCMNEKGGSLWNMTYEMQNPKIKKSGSYVAVADKNGHVVHAVDGNGKVYEIDTKLPIREFAISKEGLVAAVVEDASNSWINLYDMSGNQIVEIKATMTKTGYPLSVALSGEVMAVSYLYVNSDAMRSSVTFYNFGGVGENKSDRIVSSYEYANSVIPLVGFLDGDTAYAIGDDKLMMFAGSKKPTSIKDSIISENIVGAYVGKDAIGLVFYDDTGEHKYKIITYDKTGRERLVYRFDMDFKDILLENNQVTIYNETQCIIINDDGKEKYNGTFDENVQFLASTESAKKFIAITDKAISTIRFE